MEQKRNQSEVIVEAQSGAFPPAGTVEVRVFSDFGAVKFFVDGVVNPAINKKQGVVLDGGLAAEVYSALNAPLEHSVGNLCWSPRDALVFYDRDGEVVGGVLICFSCCQARISPKELSKNLDFGKLARVFAHPDFAGGYPFEREGVEAYVTEYEECLRDSLARRAKALNRSVVPEDWKVAEPREDIPIRPGDEVYVSSSLFLDPLDIKLAVSRDGFLTHQYCREPVQIGGLTEIEASKLMRDQLVKDEIYHQDTKVKVIRAKRFAKKE